MSTYFKLTLLFFTLLFLIPPTHSRFQHHNHQKSRNKPRAHTRKPHKKNCYEYLEIPTTASEKDIKKSFRKLALKYHPDKHTDDETKTKNEEYFKELTKCYQILSDTKQKEKYDASGFNEDYNNFQQSTHSGFNNFKGDFNNFDFGDIFGDIFGRKHNKFQGNSFRHGHQQHKNWDHMYNNQKPNNQQPKKREPIPITIELTDVMTGITNKQITLNKYNKYQINIPPGIPNDYVLKSGSKSFKIQTLPNINGYARGDTPLTRANLYKTISITLEQYLIGFNLKLKLLNNNDINIEIEPININNKLEYIIKGKGLPKFKNKKKNGDLILKFNVLFPDKLSDDKRDRLKKLMNDDHWKYDMSKEYDDKIKKKEMLKIEKQRKKLMK